ncbi:MAG: hypothetical protein HZA52_10635 [Planctomycetes bacterium]|nr:hypothetical protein [Planctomycetota bacterium]
MTKPLSTSPRRAALRFAVLALASCLFGLLAIACANRGSVYTSYVDEPGPAAPVRVPRAEPREPPALPKWAFTRYEVTREGMREALELRDDGSYSWTTLDANGSCTRDESGHARIDSGWLLLEPERGAKPAANSTRQAGTRGCVVAYGKQRCFLTEQQLTGFCNLVNAGRRAPAGCMLAAELAEPNPEPLQATMPRYYAERVLRAPVVGRVKEILVSTETRPINNAVEFIVDIGAKQGLRNGMQLYVVGAPAGTRVWPGRLIEVHESWSRGRMRSTDYVPEVDGKLSTADPRAKK